jgi:methionyl-tRNA formyltransferase
MTSAPPAAHAPRIVFLGTPRFAVGTLNALVTAGLNVVAVVTAPDRPAGRGLSLRCSEVKERALELGLPILQPEKLKDPDFLRELADLRADVQVVVAFRMLPEVVWNAPALGTINLHASLLPDYRGAAPINWAIINGERTSGVTTFRLQHAIDTGDILLQERMDISPDETAGELHDRMMVLGAALMVRTLQGLFAGTLQARPQEEAVRTHHAPKLSTATGLIDPLRSAQATHDLIRGLSPYPGAWCQWVIPGKAPSVLKVFRSRRASITDPAAPGTFRITQDRLELRCADGWLELVEVQPEGRKRMNAADLVRGIQVREGILVYNAPPPPPAEAP